MSDYIKISKPAYVAITDFMGRIAAKHREGWAKDVHTVMRRRGAADATVRVEVSEREAASVGKAAGKLAHTNKAAAKLLRHLDNKGLSSESGLRYAGERRGRTEAERRKRPLSLRDRASSMTLKEYTEEKVKSAREGGWSVSEARKWAKSEWEDARKSPEEREAERWADMSHKYEKLQASGKPWYHMTGKDAKEAVKDAKEDWGNRVKLSRSLFTALGKIPGDNPDVEHTMHTASGPMYARSKLGDVPIMVDVDELITLGRLARIVHKSDWASKAAKKEAKQLADRGERMRRSL